jgi:hypothetical protein
MQLNLSCIASIQGLINFEDFLCNFDLFKAELSFLIYL